MAVGRPRPPTVFSHRTQRVGVSAVVAPERSQVSATSPSSRRRRELLTGSVAAAVDGSPDAVNALFAQLYPMVVRYCQARIGNSRYAAAGADDVAQDVCVVAADALPRFRGGPHLFVPFVYGTAAHKVVDYFRRTGRERSYPVGELPDWEDTRPGPELQAIRHELHDKVALMMPVLNHRQREIVLLRMVAGFSIKETADAMGLDAGTVRVTQYRALVKLRTALVAEIGD